MNANSRIELVDALRGFALLGIMLLHALEHFDFIWQADKNPEIFRNIDKHVFDVTAFLFSGKAYSIFSLMFGFSFFIQMDRANSKGIDFKWRFLWRLTILFFIGYLLSLIYIGQILVIYALMGIPLIFLFRVNKNILVWIALLLILQIPTIINIISAYTNPDFEFHRSFGKGLYREAFNTFANESFLDVVKFNMWKGHIAVLGWTYYNGRYLQLFGLFILGLVLGRSRFFESYENYKKQVIFVFIGSIVLFAGFYTLLLNLPEFGIPQPRYRLSYTLIKSYTDLTFTALYISIIIMIFQKVKSLQHSSLLACYGRMSLTNYTIQPLIGVPLFYGFGLALYHYLGTTLSLFYGIIFLVFQIWFSRIWMKHFYYGPMEWVWRAFTFLDFNLKFKREFNSKQ